jgi:cytoskeletal protein RodZ
LGVDGGQTDEDGRMHRTIGLVALWLVAGVVATTVAWLGVSSVRDELGGSRSHPDPLSSEEISAELAAAPTTSAFQAEPPESSTTTTRPSEPGSTTTTAVVPPPATTTTVQPVVRSYHLIGGDVTFRFSPDGVTVVVATPSAGFTTEVGSSHGGGKQVEFESSSHKSRIDAWWDGGPQTEVREDGDD